MKLAEWFSIPAITRNLARELDLARHRADVLGYREHFEDVWILGNEAMGSRPGLQYKPMDIAFELEKHVC